MSPKRREKTQREAKLAELGERVLGILSSYNKPEEAEDIAHWEGFADDIEAAARSLGLLPMDTPEEERPTPLDAERDSYRAQNDERFERGEVQ